MALLHKLRIESGLAKKVSKIGEKAHLIVRKFFSSQNFRKLNRNKLSVFVFMQQSRFKANLLH